jgi:hypothetical protein
MTADPRVLAAVEPFPTLLALVVGSCFVDWSVAFSRTGNLGE